MTALPAPDGVTLAEFTVPSILGNERIVMERVTAALTQTNLSEAKLRKLETAVSEAAMNAIEHGNRLAPDLPVEVSVEASARSIVVRVTDHGGNGPISAPQPDLEAKLAGQQSPRGWGLFLMGEMVDEVRFVIDGNRHTVELVINRPGATVMQDSPLATKVRPHGAVTVLDLAGDIDRAAAATMESAYASAGSGPIVMNFTGVGYINSSGIALIIGFLAKARTDRRTVAAYGLTPHYEEIFEVTRLSDFITVHKDETAAVASAAH